ncbi:DUF1476 domain-containing protein [Asticcacaulis taihuensis]|jgi:hypothetical protein|uniref:DUF1476 domain-containing protein n=1 Tax=Asticcacaulis taihuensis TaxID=260084 RepID=A0A1G4S0D3_9CAUL|nr:DUF1476 domain-containing protein [Asticcacaulis taihuensis]SCW62683.1 hypothetical protein SAMN02927928_2319 [Asticcacaulis taihuensis]
MPMSDTQPAESNEPPLQGSEAFEFQAAAARNRMMALWGAEKMGLTGKTAENYAAAVVRANGEQPSEEDVIRKVLGDLTASNIAVREAEVRTKAAEFLAQAREALKS